jgi:hypothetical protein
MDFVWKGLSPSGGFEVKNMPPEWKVRQFSDMIFVLYGPLSMTQSMLVHDNCRNFSKRQDSNLLI